jgi:nitronate monooxygenase
MILRSLREPVVQAPMAGGPSTPELTVSVGDAGGFGFLAAGYRTAEALSADIAVVRGHTDTPFGVNLFVPSPPSARPEPLTPYLQELAAEAARYGVALGEPRHDDDAWREKLDLVEAQRVDVVSFTFGCPGPAVLRRLRAAGIETWVTVTHPDEAGQAAEAGADVLVVQGAEAGGHRGGFQDPRGAEPIALLALLALVRDRVDIPLVGSGAIMTGESLAAVLCAGAAAGQIGTALMRTPEAGTSPAQRSALSRPSPTGLTRAFSGRLARGIVNRFQLEHTASAVARYPEIHHVTSPVRAEARRRGDAEAFNLWAGQAFELGVEAGAGELVRRLGAEARETLQRVAGLYQPGA